MTNENRFFYLRIRVYLYLTVSRKMRTLKIVSLYAHQLSDMYAGLVMLRLKLGNSYLNMHEGEFDMLSGMELLNGGRK